MLKKKLILIGGLVAAMCIGVTGCAGNGNNGDEGKNVEATTEVVDISDSNEKSEIAETTETTEATTVAASNNSKFDYSIDVREENGIYIYKILDGKLEVPLEHRVEDYLDEDKGKTMKWFRMDKIAQDLGYELNPYDRNIDTPKESVRWELHRDDQVAVVSLGLGDLYEGASGHGLVQGVSVSFGDDDANAISGSIAEQGADDALREKAVYLTAAGSNSLSLDVIVLAMHALEFETKHMLEDPFEQFNPDPVKVGVRKWRYDLY